MNRLFGIIASAFAIGFGLLVLVGLLSGQQGEAIYTLATIFLELTAVTLGITVLIGIYNLFNVHTRRVLRRDRGLIYSVVLLVSAGLVIGLWLTNNDDANMVVLENVQVAIESALGALVLFALVYGAYRMMRRQVTWSGILFTVVLLIVLIGALPVGGSPDANGDSIFTQLRAWLLAVPVSAGQRGILLGIALATIVTGVRVLTGQDRTYRD